MDRLTKLDEKTKNYLIACRIACGACEENLLSASCSMQDAVLQKCGQYEDSGLTPERAQELGKADAEGRVVVLPCGDNVELERNGTVFKADHWNHILTCFADNQPTPSGEKVALFGIEEAEAALAKMKE